MRHLRTMLVLTATAALATVGGIAAADETADLTGTTSATISTAGEPRTS